MNTYSPYSSVTETFTYPSPPGAGTAKVSVYYEFGNIIEENIVPTLVTGNKYSVTLSDDDFGSAGVYRIKWMCKISGSDFYAYTEFKIEDTYVKYEDFFNNYPEYDLPEYTSKFDNVEKMARRIIDTYTGQDFQFIKNQTVEFDGNGREMLYLGHRLNSFSSVIVDSTDFTTAVRIDYQSKYFLKTLSPSPTPEGNREDIRAKVFPERSTIYVTGDWGWANVPWEIAQASELLMADLFDETRREHYRYGILRLEQGNNRLEFDRNIFNSTGNIDVDTLLMDFVHWTMDYVS